MLQYQISHRNNNRDQGDFLFLSAPKSRLSYVAVYFFGPRGDVFLAGGHAVSARTTTFFVIPCAQCICVSQRPLPPQ